MSKHRGRAPRIAAVLIVFFILGIIVYFLFFNISDILQPSLGIPTVGENWAGYVAASNLFFPQSTVTGVSASWVVPAVQNTGSNAYSSVWVGIGGQFDKSLIQVGTEQDSANGSPKYYAWYEMLPNNQVIIDNMQISPTDQINASISLIDSNTNTWSISISDQTTGKNFQQNLQYNSAKLTAEWIIERPAINGALTNLANFGSVTFANCQAAISGKTGAISDFTHNKVFMQPEIKNNQSLQLINISALTDNGKQFSVSYIG